MQPGNRTDFICAGRACWLAVVANNGHGAQTGQPLPLVLLPGSADDKDELLPQLLPLLANAVAQGTCRPFALVGFACQSWNDDLTPWPAPALSGKGAAFGGKAEETLAWLRAELLPTLTTRVNWSQQQANTAIAGYSLAGLFALWAWYQSGLFGGCASCSGSLWYDGWTAFATGRPAPANSRVYLSLGDREERARNPRMAAVGNATRQLAAQLAADPAITQTALEWNPGGHFADVPARLARGILYLVGL